MYNVCEPMQCAPVLKVCLLDVHCLAVSPRIGNPEGVPDLVGFARSVITKREVWLVHPC